MIRQDEIDRHLATAVRVHWGVTGAADDLGAEVDGGDLGSAADLLRTEHAAQRGELEEVGLGDLGPRRPAMTHNGQQPSVAQRIYSESRSADADLLADIQPPQECSRRSPSVNGDQRYMRPPRAHNRRTPPLRRTPRGRGARNQ
ncbi:hypothetical protein ACIQZO_28810 [Streptomyces sp. NPDC097617]|uniref:hypothetical protein n=1 Tax=Streptomyces sp. NPDC097617 TaxID=3366091 RepID=UPI00381599C9